MEVYRQKLPDDEAQSTSSRPSFYAPWNELVQARNNQELESQLGRLNDHLKRNQKKFDEDSPEKSPDAFGGIEDYYEGIDFGSTQQKKKKHRKNTSSLVNEYKGELNCQDIPDSDQECYF